MDVIRPINPTVRRNLPSSPVLALNEDEAEDGGGQTLTVELTGVAVVEAADQAGVGSNTPVETRVTPNRFHQRLRTRSCRRRFNLKLRGSHLLRHRFLLLIGRNKTNSRSKISASDTKIRTNTVVFNLISIQDLRTSLGSTFRLRRTNTSLIMGVALNHIIGKEIRLMIAAVMEGAEHPPLYVEFPTRSQSQHHLLNEE